MVRNTKTDNFVDIDISELGDIPLDLGLGADDNLEDVGLDLGLEDFFGDYKADILDAVEVVPIEDSMSKLEEIIEMNLAYDKGTRHISDKGKNDRSKRTVDKILAKIKTENNIEVIMREHKRLNSVISSHLSECYRSVESGIPTTSLLSRKLMQEGIKFDRDSEAKEVDDIVSFYKNETSLKLDERNREIALKNEGMVNINLNNINETPLSYINYMRFVPASGKMFVSCPQCLTEFEHNILESTRVMSDVEKTGVYLKHNPLFCSCGAISILKDEIVADVTMRLKEKIKSVDSEDEKSRRIATIDVGILNNIPFLNIEGEVEASEITDADCKGFLTMQQSNLRGYNKKFYTKYLSNPANISDRYSILNRGSFDLLSLTNTSIKECVVGCIYGSPYFTMIQELNRKKEMANLYIIEYNKLGKMLDYIGRDKAITGEESIELNYAIEAVNKTLNRLGLSSTKRAIQSDKISQKTIDKLKVISQDKLDYYSDLYKQCINDKANLVKYLGENSNNLFRFMSVKHLDSVDSYYREFDSVAQADYLINSVAPIVSRYNWTIKSMKVLTYRLSSKSRCKIKSSDSFMDVSSSVEKYIPISDEYDKYSFTMYESITKMPKELIRLTHDVESQNYYRFIYNVIALKKYNLTGNDIVNRIMEEISSIEATDEELRVYEMYKDIDKFEQHMSLLALDFKESDIVEFLSTSSFNCRMMRVRGGKRTIKTYLAAVNELKPHTPDKCILDLHQYKNLVCDLHLLKSISNVLNMFKDYHELVLKQVVRYVDSQYLNIAEGELLDDLIKYNKLDIDHKTYFDIDIMSHNADEVYNCVVKHTPLYTHMLADSFDDDSDNVGTVEKDTFAKILRAEVQLTGHVEFYLNLYTVMYVVDNDSNLGTVDSLVPDKYKEVFRKFYSVFNKRKYSDEFKSMYGYNEDTFNHLKKEFSGLMQLISLECNSLVFESLESKVKEFTIL